MGVFCFCRDLLRYLTKAIIEIISIEIPDNICIIPVIIYITAPPRPVSLGSLNHIRIGYWVTKIPTDINSNAKIKGGLKNNLSN